MNRERDDLLFGFGFVLNFEKPTCVTPEEYRMEVQSIVASEIADVFVLAAAQYNRIKGDD